MLAEGSPADGYRPPPTRTLACCRRLYIESADPEGLTDLSPDAGCLIPLAIRPAPGPSSDQNLGWPADLEQEVLGWARAEHERFQLLATTAAGPGQATALVRRAALGAAPLALVSGAWLHRLQLADRAIPATRLATNPQLAYAAFRIFSPDDIATIRRWIAALPGGGGVAAAHQLPAAQPAPTRPAPRSSQEAPRTLREAYHVLLNRTDSPAVRAYSRDYVRAWLRRSRVGGGQDAAQLPPPRWDNAGLRSWLQDQHDRNARQFRADQDSELPSKDSLIDSTVQLAPVTLIDGSWLQGFTDYGHASSDVGHLLFSTYWDELGNGERRLNHPLIYRAVLREMNVDLPPTSAREFAERPGFREQSFELPVYWLAIGRLPRTFMPEVLGLNLAMELSGVGGGYRQARLALKKHGFSTRFVDLHNTIDNVATGHSAWATDAVDTYMTSLPAVTGPGQEMQVWERVRTGYQSLSPSRKSWAHRALGYLRATARPTGQRRATP